uniref:Zinc finger and BTB domain containing 4 n=1 Tax=Gopherus agassizii TaxID=38772 RepID=A0A452HG69_9SAUR
HPPPARELGLGTAGARPEQLNEQRLRGQFCDVTIIAEDTKFPAHKNVLAASSPYFKEVLSEEPAGHQPAQVLELPDIQAGVFSDILNFIYRSRLSVPSPAAARQIGAAGRRLGISWLENLDPAAQAKEMSEPWSPEPAPSSSSPAGGAFRCGLCSRSFATPAALSLHLKLHRSRRSLSCRHCGKSFIHVKRLQTHEVLCKEAGEEEEEAAGGSEAPAAAPQDHFVKVVDGHVIYFCTVCERSYMTLSSLKRHSNVHSWRRKYPCRYCDKVFALAEYRTKHEVWHTGERRYQSRCASAKRPSSSGASPRPT